MQLIGQEDNLEIIKKWQTLPQFIIISGDEHTGKTYLVTYLCSLYKLHYYKMSNGISNVRKLIDIMEPDSNTLYHFKNFDQASIQAKNALLKITEEPVPGNYIVITGSSQLKTLESRARRLHMNPYSKKDVINYMHNYFENESLYEGLYSCGFNTPAKIVKYRDYENIEPLVNFTYDVFSKITYFSVDDIIVMLDKFDSRYENIDAFLLFLTMLINLIEYNMKQKHLYSYYNILNILIKGKSDLIHEPTLNRKFLLYRIFYSIYLSNKGGISK